MSVAFARSPRSTVGIEWELLLVDRNDGQPVAIANQIIAAARQAQLPLGGAQIMPELLNNTVELISCPRKTVAQAATCLEAGLDQVLAMAEQHEAQLIGAGTHPFAEAADQPVTDSDRYNQIIEQTQWWGRQMMIFGVHTHVGVDDKAKVAPVIKALAKHLPHLQALSAASPWWGGVETGYASNRVMMFQQLPFAGLPCQFDDWASFEAYTADLMRADMISQTNQIRWDVRPAPHFGTVETRFCDAMPTLNEVKAVSALTQCLVEEAVSLLDLGQDVPALPDWYVKENKFRAARFGLDAQVIVDRTGAARSLREDLPDLLTRLEPVAAKLDCLEELAMTNQILQKGASYQRQRQVAAAHGGDLTAVVKALAAEMAAGHPL
ncbi:MAG: glutamate--cysteine ligase [Micrococcales bacterium]|nr:glutamate--cysteine ligase [Micrococcales bacterium]